MVRERGSGSGQWQPASKQEMCQTARMNTNYRDRSACSQFWGWELKKERDWGKDDGNTTALSPNSGFPAARINILYSEQNVSGSGSAQSSVNSHKLGKLCSLLHWHL